jgi:hypothetical protein
VEAKMLVLRSCGAAVLQSCGVAVKKLCCGAAVKEVLQLLSAAVLRSKRL